MFPSSGILADVKCPLALRGFCERPHCFYKHAGGSRDEFDASTVDSSGVKDRGPHAVSGVPFTVETKDDSFHELERLNKEIETVRQEVEEERRRLSGCQTAKENSMINGPALKYVPDGTEDDGAALNLHKAQTKVTKYVVDNSKPRTDLEYDPLSNFSADFWCHSSSAAEQKAKTITDSKSPASTTAYDPKETSTWDFNEDNDNEDCVLIIDVPLPTEECSYAQDGASLLSGKSSHGEEKQLDKVLAASTSLESPSQPLTKSETSRVTPLSSPKSGTNKNPDIGGEKNQNQFSLNDTRCGENTGEALPRACQIRTNTSGAVHGAFPHPSNFSATPVHQYYSLKTNECELPTITEIKRVLQPLTASLSLKTSGTNSPHRCRNEEFRPQVQSAQESVHSHASSESAQLLVADGKMMSSEVPRQIQRHATLTGTTVIQKEDTGAASINSQQIHSMPSNVCSSDEVKLCELTGQPLGKTEERVIIISSEDEEELNCSDLELSDSDPMEECYKIFMEANGGEIPNEYNNGPEDEAKPAINMALQPLAGKKRLAHEPTHTEPLAKHKPQPQVLVPCRGPADTGFGSQPPVSSQIQQRQQGVPVLTASVNYGQALFSSTHKKLETQSTPLTLTTTSRIAPPQNAYLNHIPLTGAVFTMGSNLRLLVPKGALSLPVTSSSNAASILTPISRAPTTVFREGQMYHPALTILPRGRSGAPVLIPAPAQKSSLSLGSTSFSTGPSQTVAPKSVPGKRKLKQHEATKDKVPHDVRQRYITTFTEEFLKTTPNVEEAFQKALAEEKTVYNRSMNQVKYQSIAVNALKKLRHQRTSVTNENKEVKNGRLKGNIQLNLKKLKSSGNVEFYESLKDYILTDDRLIESNYPIPNPEKSGCAVLFSGSKRVNSDPLKRICCRCGATYSVNRAGKHVRLEECTYHYGKGVTKRVPGGVETRYSCCEGVMGTPGCQVFKMHVHDFLGLEGFVSTSPRCPSDTSCPGVFSLDCEKCYTVHGLELARVTVVNSNLQVVYDTFVKPTSEVIDYNTRFSGISEEDVKAKSTSFKEVQETLLSFISADTILIGHGLETALCLLKLLHTVVVDTSEVFPHRLGPPNKLALNKLTADHLRKIIQESVCGHDTADDAEACMELMLWKAKEDGKLKK